MKKTSNKEEALEIACGYLEIFVDALELLSDEELLKIMINPFGLISEAKDFLKKYENRIEEAFRGKEE